MSPAFPSEVSPFTISTAGSYYLTANLSGVSGQNGIVITAGNVTIDLAGFQLIGAAGSGGSGISISAGAGNVQIINGAVLNWGASGIDGTAGSGLMVQNVRASGNQVDGIRLGSNGWVKDCTAQQNIASGIHAVGMLNRIESDQLIGNGTGVQADAPKNLIIHNNVTASTTTDYNIVAGNDYGQIVTSPGVNFSSCNCWANFSGACPANEVNCSSVCVNTQTDANNCGACGNACTNGQSCVSGSCTVVCPAGETACAGQCVNIQSDRNNCGSCGECLRGRTGLQQRRLRVDLPGRSVELRRNVRQQTDGYSKLRRLRTGLPGRRRLQQRHLQLRLPGRVDELCRDLCQQTNG